MSALRRLAISAAVPAALCALLATGGCRIGSNPARYPAATSPRGVTVRLEWDVRPRPERTTGELLGLDERGVYILYPGGIVLYPFGAPLVLRPERRPPQAVDLRSDPSAMTEFTRFARYPFGLDDELIQRVLDAIGSDRVTERRLP